MKTASRMPTRTILLAISIAFLLLLPRSTQAQTFHVIYTFTGHSNAQNPIAGVTLDRQGNVYGTTAWGGEDAPGTVYELESAGSGFTYNELFYVGSGAKGDF